MKQTKCLLFTIIIVCCFGILSAQAILFLPVNRIEFDLLYGQSGYELVTMINQGNIPLTFTATRAPGSTFFTINGSSSTSGSIAPGDGYMLQIIVNPSEVEGTSSGAIDIYCNDPDNPSTRIAVIRNVYNPNHPPILNLPDTLNIPYNGNREIDFRHFASDPDGDPLWVSVETPGPISYIGGRLVPAHNWYGWTSIQVSVTDGEFVVTDEMQVFVNAPPVLNLPESFSFARNASLLVNLYQYIEDHDDNPYSLSLSFFGNSSITISQVGARTMFSAPNGFAGSETITIRANDGYNLVQSSFTITVINHAPALNLPESFSLDQNSNLTVDFSPFISDPDGDIPVLSYSGNSNIGVTQDGYNLTFSPAYDWFGSEELSFTVSDGLLQSSAVAQITVNLVVNLDPPVLMISGNMNGIFFSWQPIDYATEYQVFRASEPNGNYSLVATTGVTMYFESEPLERAFYCVKAVYVP